MQNNYLSSQELHAAYQAEQQYILKLKEVWLRAFDRDDDYNISESYEDEFGFNNARSLNAWQTHTLEILKRKPDHMASITYLKLQGDSTAFNSVIFSHATFNERHYEIKRANDSVSVVLRSSPDEFVMDVDLSDLNYKIILEYDADQIAASSGVTPALYLHYKFKSNGVTLAISDGLAALQVDKEIHDELIEIVLDFAERRQLPPDAFKPLCHKQWGMQ